MYKKKGSVVQKSRNGCAFIKSVCVTQTKKQQQITLNRNN